jgi:dTDP-4-dehydrorhamnose reductase
LGELVAVDHAACDLSDSEAIRALVRRVQPAVIVNPAAYTAVDKAESEAETAFAVNAIAPGIFGEEAVKLGAIVVHYSTDYVFAGDKVGFYTEDDTPNPQSVYGRSKLAGEQALQATGAKQLIFRTSWVVGAHGGNFAKTMLRLAVDRASLTVVADQWGAPTSAALLADVTAQVLRQALCSQTADFPYGLYHLVAGGETNWHQYACFVVAEAIKAGQPLKVTPEAIKAITTAEYPTPARRPCNSRLDTRKLRDTFGVNLPDWQSGLSHVLQQIL